MNCQSCKKKVAVVKYETKDVCADCWLFFMRPIAGKRKRRRNARHSA